MHHLIINLAYGIKIIHAININFWFWELIEEFMAASNGEGGNHMLLTLKMLCGLAVIAFMEISIAKKKKQQTSHKFFWITIILIIITMAIGVILPWGPISKIFGIS